MSKMNISWVQLGLHLFTVVTTGVVTVALSWHNLKQELSSLSGDLNERISVLSTRIDGVRENLGKLEGSQKNTDATVAELGRQVGELRGMQRAPQR